MSNESTMTIETDGRRAWRNKRGQSHRLDGQAIEYADGTKIWYQKNQWHRLDGPAIERANGTKYWYQKNQWHRLDGPAVEYANGTKEWWIEGKQVQALIFTHENGKLTKKLVETYAQAYEMMCENLKNEVCSWCEELKSCPTKAQ